MATKDELIRKLVSEHFDESALKRAILALDEKEEGIADVDGYLNMQEAMRFLKVSRCYLWILRRKGLRSYRLGKRILFKREDLTSYVRKHS